MLDKALAHLFLLLIPLSLEAAAGSQPLAVTAPAISKTVRPAAASQSNPGVRRPDSGAVPETPVRIPDSRRDSRARSAVQVISSSPNRLVFELSCDNFMQPDAAVGSVATFAGAEHPAKPGQPDLPGRTVLVGIPQTGTATLSVSVSGSASLSGIDVQPAPAFDPRDSKPGPMYQENHFWPASPAEITDISTMRGIRVAHVRINPVQYNPVTREMKVHQRVRVTLSFSRPGRDNSRPDALDPVLSDMLLNGPEALAWKVDFNSADSINFFNRSSDWCKIRTDTTGMYRITTTDVAKAGFNLDSINPATLKLYAMGRHNSIGPYPDTMVQVPLYVQHDGDDVFDDKDFIAFYAEGADYWLGADSLWQTNPFTAYSVFWLTWGGGRGRRMSTIAGEGATSPGTTSLRLVHIEPENLCPARSGLLWLWTEFFKQNGVGSASSDVELNLSRRDTIYEIRGRLYGKTPNESATHHVRVYLNGVLLDSVSVTACNRTPPAVDFVLGSIPLAAAARGTATTTDTLTFELYGSPEMDVLLDYVEVKYAERLEVTSSEPQVDFFTTDSGAVEFGVKNAHKDALMLDVTDPWNPKRIVGTTVSSYRRNARVETNGFTRFSCGVPRLLPGPDTLERRTPGTLRNPAERCDYCIICPDGFLAPAQLLARHRDGNIAGIANAHAHAVRLSQIYDDYTFGMEEPGAIRKFLGAKMPAYALLAGDATYDYKHNFYRQTRKSDSPKDTVIPSVPAYEYGKDIDPEVYGLEARALDIWYADADGTGPLPGDPDIALGRITSRTAVEFRAFVDKVQRYETQPLGYWAKRMLLLADDEYLGDVGEHDPIGLRHIGSRELGWGCEGISVLCGTLLDPVKVYLTEWPVGQRTKAADGLRSELDRGALLWCFFGHGAGFQINHEKTLYTTDVRAIHNDARMPLAFFGSCGVGRFEDTRFEAVAEELARFEQGCIATVGATKGTDSHSNEQLAYCLFSNVIYHPERPLGTAFFAAWPQNSFYHLFGDPTAVIRVPTEGGALSVQPDTFYPGGRVQIQAQSPVQSGTYGISVHEATWSRHYQSYTSVDYLLPGLEVCRTDGSFSDANIATSFVMPRLTYPETTVVGDGRYVRLPKTCKVSLFVSDGAKSYSSLVDTLALSHDTAPRTDHTPPEVALYADDIRLVPGDTTDVPGSFTVKGIISDQSGVLLVPVSDVSLGMTYSDHRIDLTPYFTYDRNSTTTGRFLYPVNPENRIDSFRVVVSDNVVDPIAPGSNRSITTVWVRAQADDQMRLDSCLVYPNPTPGPARFTFLLTRPASVAVRIYTIAGRLVRSLPAMPCGYGFNMIDWDGLDRDGRPLANGIYLYKLDARWAAGTSSLSAGFQDKFIVRH